MRRITLIAVLLCMALTQKGFGKDGYRIELKMPDVKDTLVYLAHYYGEPLPKIYKTDSARFDKNGVAIMESKEKTLGGIYIILLSDKKTYFEFLLNNGDNMAITANVKDLPDGIKFKNSPENVQFQDYVAFLKGFGKKQQDLTKEFQNAKTKADTVSVRKKSADASKELIAYRHDYAKAHPGTLLSTIFNALEVPQVPEGKHYLADGKTEDTTFSYTYYKAHYWDGFNFQDDRLINAPIYNAKLEEYMTKLVLPWPDSVEHESDMLLQKVKGTKDMFKFTLWWLTRNVENSKVMGMDEAFVYLVENYYMKGDATWLTNEELSKYLDRASKIAPNVIGNLSPEVKLPNVITKKEESLHGMKAKYTLLVFYSPDCGHCITEIPKIDSVYRAGLKEKGLKIFTVATEGDDKKIAEFINKNKLTDWTNTSDQEHVGDWRAKYDVYSTPTIYLMDEKKIIRGKRLDHTNIGSVIEMLEKKAKTTAKK